MAPTRKPDDENGLGSPVIPDGVTRTQSIHHLFKVVLSLTGMLVAFFGVVYLQDDPRRLLAVPVGMLLLEAAVWNLANPFLPSARRYLELRAKVE